LVKIVPSALMENPVPRLSVVSITTTDFLYNLISSWVDNFADVIKKSIAGIENVCGNRANTLKAIAIAMSQKAHLGNGRLVFGFSFRCLARSSASFLAI